MCGGAGSGAPPVVNPLLQHTPQEAFPAPWRSCRPGCSALVPDAAVGAGVSRAARAGHLGRSPGPSPGSQCLWGPACPSLTVNGITHSVSSACKALPHWAGQAARVVLMKCSLSALTHLLFCRELLLSKISIPSLPSISDQDGLWAACPCLPNKQLTLGSSRLHIGFLFSITTSFCLTYLSTPAHSAKLRPRMRLALPPCPAWGISRAPAVSLALPDVAFPPAAVAGGQSRRCCDVYRFYDMVTL